MARDSAGVIKLRVLRWGGYAGQLVDSKCNRKQPYKSGAEGDRIIEEKAAER